MRDHSQPEDTLEKKEINGSTGDNLKCLFGLYWLGEYWALLDKYFLVLPI